MKRLLFLLVFLLALSSVDAATIHGEVIAWDTFKSVEAIVEINTEPKQQDVIKENEEYRFEVKEGTYTIIAKSADEVYEYTEEITILEDEGDYVFDLVLFDALIDDPLVEPPTDPGNLGPTTEEPIPWYVWAVLVVVILVGLFFIFKKKPKNVEKIEEEVLQTDEDLEKVLRIIKENQGRITQKDVRKQMVPLSEAKVSLLITELEDKGVVKRIKKGRGNVIILVKK
tara:strand:+ start:747 stop:1427 length:681 start_codon:yes stop_codon:yes gene_type:complete